MIRDPAGMATFRALALIAAHPEAMRRARQEVAAAGEAGRQDLPFLRACFLESLRLYPTTPAILRETTEDVSWQGRVTGKNASIVIFTPFFHRDDENLPYAHRFTPELWLDAGQRGRWPLIPFSEGPGACPAHHLVPMLGSAMVAAILQTCRIESMPPNRLRHDQALPGTLDNYTLRFRIRSYDPNEP